MAKRYSNNRILAFGDTHAPYNHKKTLQFLKEIKEDLNPDRIIHMGDLNDIYSISDYPKDIDHPDTWKDEFAKSREFTVKLTELFPYMELLDSNHDCFDDSTEILVEGRGFIPFSMLKMGMKIGTFNRETSVIEYQEPIRIIKDPYNGQLIHIKGSHSVDLLVTNNHRLLVSKRKRNNFKMITAHNLIQARTNRVFFKDCGINVKRDLVTVSDDMIRLVGWHLTDSSSKGDKVLFHQRVSNSFKIKDLLNRLEIPYKSYIKDCSNIKEICGRTLKKTPENQEVITIYSKYLSNLVPDRYTVPPWVYDLSKRQIDILLEVLIEADGSYYKDNRKSYILYGTYNFLNQIQTILIHSGYRVNLVKYREKDWKLNILERVESCIDKFETRIKYRNYSGMIYCAEVPNDTLVIRRNGRVSITGNSRAYRKARVAGIPREFLVPYMKVIGAPDGWKLSREVRITVDKDRSQWLFVHTANTSALQLAQYISRSVCLGHNHVRFGASAFNNGEQLLWGVDAGCLISDQGSPFKYNKTQVGRPVQGCVAIIEGKPVLINL